MESFNIEITQEVSKRVATHLFTLMKALESKFKGLRRRTIKDRLDELDLWDTESIIDEYIRIKDHQSTLPCSLRKAVITLFNEAVKRYIKETQN